MPLAIGGANVVAKALAGAMGGGGAENVLEVELQRRVCHGCSPKPRRSAKSRTIGRPPMHAMLAARRRLVRVDFRGPLKRRLRAACRR